MAFPEFDAPVGSDGYSWWYIDAVSDDGRNALTVIVFLGSVFSPYYAWARGKTPAAPENHCAFNVALYGESNRWAMTERAANSTQRTASRYRIGPSEIRVENDELVCDIEETAVPIPRRIAGQLRIQLNGINEQTFAIDNAGLHHWRALLPQTRIQVALDAPSTHWQGSAYVDSNYGHEPMEKAFVSWNWSRAHLAGGDTIVQYDVKRRDGSEDCKTLRFTRSAQAGQRASLNRLTLEGHGLETRTEFPKSRYWRMPRSTRTERGASISDFTTLEDTPFYTRNRFSTQICGGEASCVHESIDFDRFAARWVQCLLPFRMPRRSSAFTKTHHRDSDAITH